MTGAYHCPFPHYVTLDGRQIRIWRSGSGPNLVVLPGLSLGASVIAARVSARAPNWTVTVLELPGLGGSVSAAAKTLDEVADHLARACAILGIELCSLVSFDLCAPVMDRLRVRLGSRPAATISIGFERAKAWKRRGFGPPSLAARPDGAHLTALWAHLRDCCLLDPADPRFPAAEGERLPSSEELHESLVAAGLSPEAFERLWSLCLADIDISGTAREGDVLDQLAYLDDLPERLARISLGARAAKPPPVTGALADGRIWNEYVNLPAGRMHVRRAGVDGRPLLLFPSGGGSSATFAPVIERLAQSHRVVAVDYFGNGESDKPERAVTIETLADDAIALADALGFDDFDLWGSHTGALVAMELTVRHPKRVGRAVLEGPVFISAAFQADLLEKYFPPMKLDSWGLHLQLFWNWRRDLFMYWPWYKVDYAAARRLGIPDAADMHRFVMGLLQSGPQYGRAYRSAYIYKTSERITHIERPTLICAGPNDMLVEGLVDAERLAPKDVTIMRTPTTAWWPAQQPDEIEATLDIYQRFFSVGAADSRRPQLSFANEAPATDP